MKRVRFVVCLIALMVMMTAGLAFSQEQGAKELGFNMSLTHSTVEMDDADIEVNQVDLTGQLILGYFLTDNLELGTLLLVSTSEQEYEDGDESTTTMFTPGILGRYLFGEGRLRPFVGLNVSYLGMNMEQGDVESDITGYQIGGQIGVKYFFSEKTALNFEYDPYYTEVNFEIDEYDIDEDATGYGGIALFGISVFF